MSKERVTLSKNFAFLRDHVDHACNSDNTKVISNNLAGKVRMQGKGKDLPLQIGLWLSSNASRSARSRDICLGGMTFIIIILLWSV